MIARTASAGNASSSSLSVARHRINSLGVSLSSIERCTTEAGRCCDTISRLARQLDSLTSPASDASAILTQASENLASTLWRIKDAREKFDTVPDCEPAIQRLASGAKEAMEASIAIHQRNSTASVISTTPNAVSSSATGTANLNRRGGIGSGGGGGGGGGEEDEIDAALFSNKLSTFLTEQDIHAAADSMDILRDAYAYFLERPKWKSTPSTLRNIERVHREGMNSMALLLKAILTAAGPACRLKSTAANISTNVSSVANKKTSTPSRHEHETAQDTRRRLTDALQKKDLLKSVGEYEDFFPLDSTSLREIRAIMECLRGDANNNGSYLGASSILQQREAQQQKAPLSDIPPGTKVIRTEKVGSGFYSNLSKRSINTGYPLLDAYGEARKTVALASLENFHRQLKAEQKKKIARQPRSSSAAVGQVTKSINAAAGGTALIANTASVTNSATVDVDTAARDAVRCLEHAMVVVAGEKTIYRSIISKTVDSSKEPLLSPEYITACVHAYSYVVSAVVDRAMDIIELVFFKEAGIGLQQQHQQQQQPSITTVPTSTSEASETGAGSPSPLLSIRAASSAAAAGLRILDGVRILGPSLAKLCELSEYRGDSQQLLAGQLCISIHRTTVKQCARTLENLVKAIQTDSSDGDQYTLSSNVVRAIRIISPFVHAYKSVAKRRLVTMNEKNINAPTA
jgi:exocyst complex protein 7